jgi:GT2 family glycosyltransferase
MVYSVVIATLGGPTLQHTIKILNASRLPPDEILICIPGVEGGLIKKPDAQNVKIVITALRGQVTQRAVGFQKAKNSLVLQLDDDMLPEKHCIESLIESMQRINDKAAISPMLVDTKTNQSVYKKSFQNPWLSFVYYWLLNGDKGYQPGTVLCAGVPLGVDEKNATGELIKVEWLPGGCVLHRKENLVLESFFPYEGKAYCEDLIHSYHLKSQGVSLYVDTNARCAMDVFDNSQTKLRDLLLGLKRDLRARKYYMNLIERRSIRVWFFYATSLFGFALKRLHAAGLRLHK